MKKWIAILFILALCGTLLPAVLSFEQKKVVLFSTIEEKQSEQTNDVKSGGDDIKALLSEPSHLVPGTAINFNYPCLFILFSDDPCLGNHTPPPDWFC